MTRCSDCGQFTARGWEICVECWNEQHVLDEFKWARESNSAVQDDGDRDPQQEGSQ